MSVQIIVDDVLAGLAKIDRESVDCVVTSPPYWGLRDYGVDGQLGMEPSLGEHIERMVEVFRSVREVMKPEGTLWLNYGDCYASTPNGRSAADTKAAGNDDRTFRDKPFSTIGGSLKPKDLCMIPNRLAIALQEDGWWVRSEIIWAKPNPMPDSSGRYRPSTAHEKIWLLTKSAKSYYDSEAVRMRRITRGDQKQPDGWDTTSGAHGTVHRNGRSKGAVNSSKTERGHVRRHVGLSDRWDKMTKAEQQANGRLLRNAEPAPWDHAGFCGEVWNIPIAGFKDAHFATFPPALVEPCIASGCPEGGLVLDPFGGAGTTALVADRMGRDSVLIELNPEYAEMARRRIEGDAGLFAEVGS